MAVWEPVINVVVPFFTHLNPAIVNGLKNTGEIEDAINTFSSLVEATRDSNATVFEAFKSKVTAP